MPWPVDFNKVLISHSALIIQCRVTLARFRITAEELDNMSGGDLDAQKWLRLQGDFGKLKGSEVECVENGKLGKEIDQ